MNYTQILSHFNITALTEMQNAAIDAISRPNDVLLISPTGSGKTLAFLLPILQMLNSEKEGVQALIVVPTRELAQQIEQVFKKMGTSFKINCCYGGHSVQIEANNLQHPPAILVGTPGRIGHHIRKKNIDLRNTNYLILDEFDKSLEAGFQEEMSFIVYHLKKLQKRVLTSATSLKNIPDFVGIKDPTIIDFTSNYEQKESGLQIKYVRCTNKLEALLLLIGKLNAQSTLVFCNFREAINIVSSELTRQNIEHGIYHGALDQIDREKVLIKLRNGSIKLLITTDLASRGLDIPEIEAVIHYQLPTTEDVMIHRNGRTARMHANGTAYLLLEEKDYLPRFLKITPEEELLPAKLIIPSHTIWKTLYIGAGKKDKINKMDIVGMLLQKGNLNKEELGKIEVLDHSAYAAIKREKIEKTLYLIRDQKIKNKKIKFEIST